MSAHKTADSLPDDEQPNMNGKHGADASDTKRAVSLNGVGRKDTRPAQQEGKVNEAADDPHRLARLFLAAYRRQGQLTLRYWRDEWTRWNGIAWELLATKDLRARLCASIKAEFDRLNLIAIRMWEEAGRADSKGKPCPAPIARKVTTKIMADAIQALGGLALLASRTNPPCWIDGAPKDFLDFDPAEMMICRNGIGHLPRMANDGELYRHTPSLFAQNALNYDYVADAPEPTLFLTFLRKLWPDDEESIGCLQEWFGYLLTPDTRQQKILLIVGPKPCGSLVLEGGYQKRAA
jgi:putative DNA primase/helicase